MASSRPREVGTSVAGEAEAAAYGDYLATPEGRLRCELFWSNLAPHLPLRRGRSRLRALDAGGGPGELARRLAERGLEVTLLDVSPAMLDSARSRLGDGGVSLRLGKMEDARRVFGRAAFDVVACHLAMEYSASPRSSLGSLCETLRRGGLLSLAWRNPDGESLKLAARGDLAGAAAALKSTRFVSALGTPGHLVPTPHVHRWLRALGLRVIAERGVRIFPTFDPARYEEHVALERAADSLDPIRRVARYVQIVARKVGRRRA